MWGGGGESLCFLMPFESINRTFCCHPLPSRTHKYLRTNVRFVRSQKERFTLPTIDSRKKERKKGAYSDFPLFFFCFYSLYKTRHRIKSLHRSHWYIDLFVKRARKKKQAELENTSFVHHPWLTLFSPFFFLMSTAVEWQYTYREFNIYFILFNLLFHLALPLLALTNANWTQDVAVCVCKCHHRFEEERKVFLASVRQRIGRKKLLWKKSLKKEQ